MKFLSRRWEAKMNSIWTVIKFTFLSRFRTKSFQVMSLILLILMSLLIHLPAIIKHFSSDEAMKIGVFGTQQAIVASKLEAFITISRMQRYKLYPFQIKAV